ncbi:MAG: hypothetical protein HKN50_11130 [Gammaproteobacteria bacterium]|nr:hypothetical protein [Gammaproteobacteria bacterium]
MKHLYSTDMLYEFYHTNQLRNYDFIVFSLDDRVFRESLLRQTLTHLWGYPAHIIDAGMEQYVFIFDLRETEND